MHSAPGLPHPLLRAWDRLRGQGVPAEDLLDAHTDLQPAALPGGYAAHAVAAALPALRVTHDLRYGPWFDGRAQAVRALPGRDGVRMNRVPVPRVVPPAAPEDGPALAARLAACFGPQGVRRFDDGTVAQADLPEAVARPLLRTGLPVAFDGWFTLHHPGPDGVLDGARADPLARLLPTSRTSSAGRTTSSS